MGSTIFKKSAILKCFNYCKLLQKKWAALVIILFLGILTTSCTNIPSSDFEKMVTTLSENLPGVVKFLTAFAYVSGFWLIFAAMHELRIYGQVRTMMPLNVNFSGPVARMAIGALLMFLPGTIDFSLYSLWGYGTTSVLTYPSDMPAGTEPVIKALIGITRVIGYIAFIRGFTILTRTTRQNAPPGITGKALMHIFGGIVAINIVGTMNVLKATLGMT
jgi:intracellular multiplication protein IcmC